VSLTRKEISARQSVGAYLGHIRRMARECGLDPDEIIYSKKVDGEVRWFPGKLLLENGIPPLPPDEQEALEEWKSEVEWREAVKGLAEQSGCTEEEIVNEIIAVAEKKLAAEAEEVQEL
jgi:hypothetical protein